MSPCLSFRTVASRKLTELVDIWCVNFIDGATLFRWSMNFLFSFHIKKMSSNDEPYLDYNVVGPLCFVYEAFFESSRINICEVGCNSGSHCCPIAV